jgi:hypothetical protein
MGFQVVEIDGATFTADGRLKVAQEPPVPPPATTPVELGGIEIVGNTPVDTVHTIGTGKTLVIQNLSGGAAPSTLGSKVELHDDPNGNGTGMTLLRVAYVSGASFSLDLNRELGPGNGTHAVRLRRASLGGSSREIAAFMAGYERTAT